MLSFFCIPFIAFTVTFNLITVNVICECLKQAENDIDVHRHLEDNSNYYYIDYSVRNSILQHYVVDCIGSFWDSLFC
jgi:hypothetical protein